MKINSAKIFICLIFFAQIFGFSCLSSYADTPKKLNDEKTSIEQKRSNATQQIRKLKLLEKIEVTRLYKNQQKLENAERALQKNEKQYQNAEKEMNDLTRRLDKVLVHYKEHSQYTQKRLIQMYKHRRNKYVEFLLNSGDINAFLDRLYFENIIIAYDAQKLKEAKHCAREMLALQGKIAQQKKNLKDSISSIDKQKSIIDIEISKNKRLIEKLQTDRATWEKAERELAKQSKAITLMINQEAKKSQKSGSAPIVVTSGFIRPVSGQITSPFGMRVHPIFKRKIFHSGIDIGAPYGAPIKASNSGRVIFVGWYSGYGKVIIIDHGSMGGVPITTLYAHLSSTLVKQGQNVARGAVIGKVGTTGYATGPHCHFEVRQKGNPTNPLNFIR